MWLPSVDTHRAVLRVYGFCPDNPGEPVPEETFTHSQLSWSSFVRYMLHPSTTIHGILHVQSTHLTIFFRNLSPSFLWSTSWPGTLHFILHILQFFFTLFQCGQIFILTVAHYDYNNLFSCALEAHLLTYLTTYLPTYLCSNSCFLDESLLSAALHFLYSHVSHFNCHTPKEHVPLSGGMLCTRFHVTECVGSVVF